MEIKYTEGFLKSWEKLFHWKYAPLRLIKFIIRIPREIGWKWQRMNRGWADCDVWGMHYHVSNVISGMLEHLSEHHCGHPGDITNEKWEENLKKWAKDIKAYNIMSDMPDGWTHEKEMEAYKQTKKGLKDMAEYYGHLWD